METETTKDAMVVPNEPDPPGGSDLSPPGRQPTPTAGWPRPPQPPLVLPASGGRSPRSKRVRPYALTGGRTRTRYHLLVETLVSVPRYDPAFSEALMPESRALYERARAQLSIAELSALLLLPLGVVRVLISDLATQGAVLIHPTAHAFHNDRGVLEKILRGLGELSG
jgi:Protein of unknown function (DUF742)